jgi:hypothetical protein
MGHGPVPVLGQSAAPQPFNLFLFSFSFLFCFLLIFGLKLLQNLYFEIRPTIKVCKSFPLLSETYREGFGSRTKQNLKKGARQGEGMHEMMHDFMCKIYKIFSQKLGCYKSNPLKMNLALEIRVG